ncbi:vegetative cell wall protein gp1-like [Schistocerca americana]|uniref:vegetative cell wall protein gp1-like n=1 Tax=Schistocerca americana TaxID=7009 RepID=UPI001F4FB128|nr:vegetative cell wall protein gp1-like [Schistocerca americana]
MLRWRTATASALQQTQPLPTANTFAGASVDAPGDGDAPLAPPQKNPPPPPPIVVQWDGVYKHFQQKLERVATSTTVKAVGRDLHKPRLPTSLPPPGQQQQQPSPLPRRQPVPLMPPAQLHPGAPQVVTPAPAVPLQSPPPSELMDVDPSAGPPSQAVAVQPVLQPLSLGTPKESDTAAPCPAPTQQPSTQRQETLPLFVDPDAPSRPVPEAAPVVTGAATLPHTRQQESGVPPRASPAALQEFAGPAAVASVGVAPLDSTIREVDVPPFAPLAPETQEEPVPAPVEAPSCARGNPAVWTGAQSAADTTEVDAIELPGAKLAEQIAEAERRDIDPDDARAPRKRRVVTHDDSDNASLTSDTARPRKKASRASRASTTEAVKTVASSSRSTANPRPATMTQRPSSSPAASRQPDADAAEDGDAPLAPPQKQPPPPPPIVVEWDGAYMDFQQKLDRVATSTTVKAAGRDLYKVTVTSNEE